MSVYGSLPNSAGVDRPDPGPGMDFSGPGAKTVINEAPPDTRYGVSWSVSGHADAEGRVTLRATQGPAAHAALGADPGPAAWPTRRASVPAARGATRG